MNTAATAAQTTAEINIRTLTAGQKITVPGFKGQLEVEGVVVGPTTGALVCLMGARGGKHLLSGTMGGKVVVIRNWGSMHSKSALLPGFVDREG